MREETLLLWLFTMLVLTLGFLLFWGFSVWGGISESLRTSAALNAQQIAGIINTMYTAPIGTVQKFELPPIDCKIKFDKMIINVSISQKNRVQEYEIPMLEAPLGIDIITNCKIPNVICCKKDIKTTIYFTRCFRDVKISKDPVNCKIEPYICDEVGIKKNEVETWINDAKNLLDLSTKQRLEAVFKIDELIKKLIESKHYNADGSVYITESGIGLMQLTPDIVDNPKKLCDPVDNIIVALNHLDKELLTFKTYGDDYVYFAVAAYRFGEKYVDRYINKGEKWDVVKFRFPLEVRNYVERIISG